jgi:hypothetical protein
MFVVIAVLTAGCSKQAAIVPSYISVPNFSFSVAQGQGSASQYITDAWVYVDDESIGAFQIPAKFPVLKEGTHVIKIKPGILLDGNESQRAAYPFYETFVDTITLVKGQITEVKPHFSYFSSTVISLNEDFENSASIKFSRTNVSDTIINIVGAPDAFEGTSSGEIALSDERPLFEMKSFNSFTYENNKVVFLEINCKANYDFSVGLFANFSGTSQQVTVLQVAPSVGGDLVWRKIYVNLTPTLRNYFQATNFNIFIGSLKASNSLVQPRILIDNIKLVGI